MLRGGGKRTGSSYRTIPEDLYQKLDSVLTRMLDKPEEPPSAELMSLDKRKRELKALENSGDTSALGRAKLQRAYDKYQREYNLYMGKQNPFTPTGNLIDLDEDGPKAPLQPTKLQNPQQNPLFQSTPKTKTPRKKRTIIPKSCTLCGESFMDGRGLGSHMRNVHTPTPKRGKKSKKRAKGRSEPIWLTL